LTPVKTAPSLVIMRTLQEIQADVLNLVGGISPAARERDRDQAMALVQEAFELGKHQPRAFVSYPDKSRADQSGAAAGYSGAI
jgi:hypothetical protein